MKRPKTLSATAWLACCAWLAGCGADPHHIADRKVFLTNIETPRTLVDGKSRDLLDAELHGVSIRAWGFGFDLQRIVVPMSGTEVRFHDVLESGAVLSTAAVYRDLPGSPSTYEMEVLAESPQGERKVVWSRSLGAPSTEEERSWIDIEEPLPFDAGDLIFRSTWRGQDSAPGYRKLAAWRNPVVLHPDTVFERAPGPARRNIVVFLVDTLRPDHLGVYGYDRPTSPNLDALARESLVFSGAHSAAPWTKPSVASLLSSIYPSQHGAEGFQSRLGEGIRTLAEVLEEANYRTCAVGYNGWIFNRKFNVVKGFGHVIPVYDSRREGGTRADTVVDEAIDWIMTHRADPFFVYLHTVDPHEPYVPTQELRERFARGDYHGELSGRLTGPGAHPERNRNNVDEADLRFLHDLYDAEIRFSDAHLGRLIDTLKALDLYDETTIVFTADHGEEFLDHGAWSHGGSIYEEQIRVPLVLKPPKSAGIPPRKITKPVSLIDVAPTLTHIAGIPRDLLPFQGQNLIPLAMAPKMWKERVVLAEVNKEDLHIVSLQSGNKKYIRYLLPQPRELLFDLELDPLEQNSDLSLVSPKQLTEFRSIFDYHMSLIRPSGVVVEFLTDQPRAKIKVHISAAGGTIDYDLDDVEKAEDRFEEGQGGCTFHFALGGDDTRDAILLRPAPDQELVVNIQSEGLDVPPTRILLGETAATARSMPLKVTDDDRSLWVSEAPAWDAREGSWCRIWNLRPPEVELSDDESAELKALGYLGD